MATLETISGSLMVSDLRVGIFMTTDGLQWIPFPFPNNIHGLSGFWGMERLRYLFSLVCLRMLHCNRV